jgi:hydantoinase/carbamoylase family amidase
MAAGNHGMLRGERLLRDLDALAVFGALPEGGIDRPAFSPAFMAASAWLVDRMNEAGLTTRTDAAGSIIGRLGPAGVPTVICGSHIDTVPGGGHLDGALGVLAGLECARALAQAGACRDVALEIVAFSDEEGAYVSLLGSRAMAGDLDGEILRGPKGELLAAVMAGAGLDASKLGEARRDLSDVAAYIELHIEQGPVLENAGLSVGVVDAIVGMDLVHYRLLGEARHAGSTPMSARRDAGRGACLAVTRAFEAMAASELHESGRMTFGHIECRPGATNVVPAEARVASEVRAANAEQLGRLRAIVDDAFQKAAAACGLSLFRDSSEVDDPAALSLPVMTVVRSAAAKAGIPTIQLSSGACHDAQTFAPKVPAGMIFVSSRNGISHHRDEFTEPAAIVAGATVLLGTLQDLLARAGSGSKFLDTRENPEKPDR